LRTVFDRNGVAIRGDKRITRQRSIWYGLPPSCAGSSQKAKADTKPKVVTTQLPEKAAHNLMAPLLVLFRFLSSFRTSVLHKQNELRHCVESQLPGSLPRLKSSR